MAFRESAFRGFGYPPTIAHLFLHVEAEADGGPVAPERRANLVVAATTCHRIRRAADEGHEAPVVRDRGMRAERVRLRARARRSDQQAVINALLAEVCLAHVRRLVLEHRAVLLLHVGKLAQGVETA